MIADGAILVVCLEPAHIVLEVYIVDFESRLRTSKIRVTRIGKFPPRCHFWR